MNKHTWYFTYGDNHLDAQGNSLGGAFTPITVETESGDGMIEARERMFAARNDKFCGCYSEEDKVECIDPHGLSECAVENVILPHRAENWTKSHRARIEQQIQLLDKIEQLLKRLPAAFVDKATLMDQQLDFNNLTREEALQAMGALNASRWTKCLNTSYDGCIDYTGTVDGVSVRLWAAGAPESCRVVEFEEHIPAQTIIRKKLICTPE